MNLTATKTFELEIAHHLPGYDGPCMRVHGHSYLLEITVKRVTQGWIDGCGFVIDFSKLKQVVKENIVDKFDHQYLNDFLPNPTAEKFIQHIDDLLREPLLNNDVAISRIRLWETSTSYIELAY